MGYFVDEHPADLFHELRLIQRVEVLRDQRRIEVQPQVAINRG